MPVPLLHAALQYLTASKDAAVRLTDIGLTSCVFRPRRVSLFESTTLHALWLAASSQLLSLAVQHPDPHFAHLTYVLASIDICNDQRCYRSICRLSNG